MEPPIVSTNHQPFLKTQPEDPPPPLPAPKFQPPLIATFILLVAIGAIGGFLFAKSLTQPKPVSIPVNWKTYQVKNQITEDHEGIEYKLPSNINAPVWANAGHYYQTTTLLGNTRLGIFFIGKGNGYQFSYDELVNEVVTKNNLDIEPRSIGGLSAIEFSGSIPPALSQNLLILGEGEGKFKGVIAKINEDKSLYLLHYREKFDPSPKDFPADEKTFGLVLSTFRFLD